MGETSSWRSIQQDKGSLSNGSLIHNESGMSVSIMETLYLASLQMSLEAIHTPQAQTLPKNVLMKTRRLQLLGSNQQRLKQDARPATRRFLSL